MTLMLKLIFLSKNNFIAFKSTFGYSQMKQKKCRKISVDIYWPTDGLLGASPKKCFTN